MNRLFPLLSVEKTIFLDDSDNYVAFRGSFPMKLVLRLPK